MLQAFVFHGIACVAFTERSRGITHWYFLFRATEKKLGDIQKKLSSLRPITGFPFSRGFKKVNAQGFGYCF